MEWYANPERYADRIEIYEQGVGRIPASRQETSESLETMSNRKQLDECDAGS